MHILDLCSLPMCWIAQLSGCKAAGWHAVGPRFNSWTGYLFNLSGYFFFISHLHNGFDDQERNLTLVVTDF